MAYSNTTPPSLWAMQFYHLLGLAILLTLVGYAWTYLGQPFPVLFWSAVAIPIAHQVFVWLCWRLELNHSTISNSIGFKSYLVIFFTFLISRPIITIAIAYTDAESLGLPLLPRIILTTVLGVIFIYAAYSTEKYFGFARGAGADHFDPKYRTMPFVRGGIFKYTKNGMYAFVFFIFWTIAIGFNSALALLFAAYSHAYIWLHYFVTERPDMNYLYGNRS